MLSGTSWAENNGRGNDARRLRTLERSYIRAYNGMKKTAEHPDREKINSS